MLARVEDVIIVGAGPVGLAVALELQRAGISPLLVDKGTVAESIRRFPRDIVFFSEAKNIEIGGYPLACTRAKPTRHEALRYFQRVAERAGLRVRPYCHVRAIQRRGQRFLLRAQSHRGKETLSAAFVVVATGYFDNPNRLAVPGEELPHVHHRYEEAAAFFGCQVVIVGGSNSAVEAALELTRAGAKVTLIHRGAELRPTVKYWLAPDFYNRLREEAIAAFFQATVQEITLDGVHVLQAGTPRFIPADFVLVLCGYRASDTLLRLARVAYERDKPILSETFETSLPGLFAVGSCAFGSDTRSVFIENGREHARLAAAAIASRIKSKA